VKRLAVFLNELSFACSMSPEAMLPHVLSTLAAIRAARRIRADMVLVGLVPVSQVLLADGTCTMAAVLRGDVQRDEWRFLASLDQASPWSGYPQAVVPGQLEEVIFQGQSAIGMLWATRNDSTIASFAFPPNWADSSVQAELHQIDDTGSGFNSVEIAVPNLSGPEHVAAHRELITTYGRDLAKSSLIYEGDGFFVRIWFTDHPPPHFHVMLRRDTSDAAARYAIDTVDLLSGQLSPPVRRRVEEWARARRDELMSSWIRCSNGQHPFRIEE
jgi:hypothetical protein